MPNLFPKSICVRSAPLVQLLIVLEFHIILVLKDLLEVKNARRFGMPVLPEQLGRTVHDNDVNVDLRLSRNRKSSEESDTANKWTTMTFPTTFPKIEVVEYNQVASHGPSNPDGSEGRGCAKTLALVQLAACRLDQAPF